MCPAGIDKRGDHVVVCFSNSPFAVIERVACWRLYVLFELSRAIGNENVLVCGVIFPDEVLACFAREVQECGPFTAVFCKGCIAGLFFVIPNGILALDSCSQ